MSSGSDRLIRLIREAQSEDDPSRREMLWIEVRQLLADQVNFEDHTEKPKTWPAETA